MSDNTGVCRFAVFTGVGVAMHAAAEYARHHYPEGNPTAMTIEYDPEHDGGDPLWTVVLYGGWQRQNPKTKEAASGG